MARHTLGNQRLGAGEKMQIDTRTYGRSTHDIGYMWRGSAAPGVLHPFMSEVMNRH